MNIMKRIIASIMIIMMVVLQVPLEVLADVSVKQTVSVDNGYVKYTINKKTGGFSISTIEGHPQKLYDNNIPLLFQEDTNSTETSFTTIRIDGKDYIFGQDYGWLGTKSKLYEPTVNNSDKTIITKYEVNGVEITQKVAVSSDQNNDMCGNVGVSYEVKNIGSAVKKVGIRTLLDTAIANTDAPYMMAGYENTPTVTEREFVGSDVPDQIRGLNSITNPSVMNYTLFKGWSNGVVPDKVIVGHWANLANTRYDYVPNKNCDFSNYSSIYNTPDSAIAMFWTEQNLDAGALRKGEFLYGIGNFSSQLTKSDVNMNVTVERVHVTKDKKGYENDGIFKVRVEVDNTVDGAKKIDNATISLSLQEGLSIVTDNIPGDYDLITASDIETGTIEAGKTLAMYWRVKAEPQTTITAKEIGVSFSTLNSDTLATNRYVILPSTTGNLPNITFDSVIPGKFYAYGDKNMSITGNLTEFSALVGKAGWSLYLRHTRTNSEVEIEKSKIAFVGENFKSLSISTDEDLPVGEYEVVFKFVDDELVNHFGKEIVVGSKIESCLDEKYKNLAYGIITVVRYDTDKYKIELIPTEEMLMDYREENKLNNFDCTQSEMLLEIRGRIKKFEEENGEVYYSVDSSQSEVTINNIVQYSGDEPLIIKQDNDGVNSGVTVKGNGDLSVVDHLEFWKFGFKIAFVNGYINTLEPEKIKLDGATIKNVLIEFTGIGKVIQNISGFVMDLNYGVLTESWDDNKDGGREGYAINFGGGLAIPFFNLPKSKKSEENSDTGGSGGNTGGSGGESGSGTAQGGDAEAETSDLENNFFAINIENVLYGESEDEETNEVGVEFLGINANASFGLPKDAFGSFIKNSPGVQANLEINTLDGVYGINGGVQLVVVTCAGELKIKIIEVNDVKFPVPDTLMFSIGANSAADENENNKPGSGSGDKPGTGTGDKPGGGSDSGAGIAADVGVPLFPPFVMLSSLGGGYENLGDSITGSYMGSLPPLTLNLEAGVDVIEVLEGEMAMSINLSGFSLVGRVGIDNLKNVGITGKISSRWVDPWFLTIGGEISIFDVIVGGVTITVSGDYFLGHAYVRLLVPDFIPLVGGKAIAGAEAMISNTMIGANIKIIGIKLGISYYWASKEVEFGRTKTFRYVDETPFGSENEDAMALYGTNIRPLDTYDINTFAMYDSNNSANDENKVQKIISFGKGRQAAAPDAMLFEIPYTSSNGYIPVASDITLTGPNGKIDLVQETDTTEGNFMTQDLGDDGKYIYISVTSDQDINPGSWTVESANQFITVQNKLTVSEVKNIPELNSIKVETRADVTSDKIEANWNFDCDSSLLEDAKVDVYLTQDAKALTDPQNMEDLGIVLGSFPANDKSASLTIPDTLSSGNYYVVSILTIPDCGPSMKALSTPITFENKLLPGAVSGVKVTQIGNGMIAVDIEENADEEYTGYNIVVYDSQNNEVENTLKYYSTGSDILIGNGVLAEKNNYKIAVQTINEADDKKYVSDKITYSEQFTMPEVKIPELISIESNFDGVKYSAENKFKVKYEFDQEVNLRVLVNSVNNINSNEYKKVWEFTKELKDGDYAITVEAENKAGDIYRTKIDENTAKLRAGAQNPVLVFTVDTTMPVLKISSFLEDSLESTSNNAVKTSISNQNVDLKDGRLILDGLTEPGAILTLDGSAEGITVQSNGKFTIDRLVNLDNQSKKSMLLSVTDKANNKNLTVIYISDGDLKSVDSLSIKIKNADGTYTDMPVKDEIKTVTMKTGEKLSLGVMSKYITTNNDTKELDMSQDNISWTVIYGGNIINLSDGEIEAILPGEVVIKAGTTSAQFTVENKEQTTAIEDYFVLTIEGEPQYGKPNDDLSNDNDNYNDADTLNKELNDLIQAVGSENILKTLNVYKHKQENIKITDKLSLISPLLAFEKSDILVVYKPKDADKLPAVDSKKILSGIWTMQTATGQTNNKSMTFTYDYSQDEVKNAENVGLYKYNRLYDKWEYVLGQNNIADKKIVAEANELNGIYAFIEDSNFNKFADVENNWAEKYIYRLSSLDIINGSKVNSEFIFNSKNPITRIEFIKLAVASMNIDKSQYSDVQLPFEDLSNIPDWAIEYIKVAYANKWVMGKSNGKGIILDANSEISREEAVTILDRIKSLQSNADVNEFKDTAEISNYAADAINRFSSLGIVNGYSEDKTFRPKVSIKREEAAKIVSEWIDKVLMK